MADDNQAGGQQPAGGTPQDPQGGQGGGQPTPPPVQQPVNPAPQQPIAPQPPVAQPGAVPPVQPPMPPAQPAAPMGVGQPMAGGAQPAGGTPQPPPAGTGNSDPNYVFGIHLNDFKTNVRVPAHNLTFDELNFLKLLAGSISLTKLEKKKIVQSVPKLSQFQVDELMRILTEEKEKFIELSPKYGDQLKRLEQQHWADWQDIETEVTQSAKGQQDQQAADDIKKNLGL